MSCLRPSGCFTCCTPWARVWPLRGGLGASGALGIPLARAGGQQLPPGSAGRWAGVCRTILCTGSLKNPSHVHLAALLKLFSFYMPRAGETRSISINHSKFLARVSTGETMWGAEG